MIYYVGSTVYDSEYLEHYGIKGMKWGVRRWQNADGTFNQAGKQRYFGQSDRQRAKTAISYGRASGSGDKTSRFQQKRNDYWENVEKQAKEGINTDISTNREISKEGSNSEAVQRGAVVAMHLLTGNIPGLIGDAKRGIDAGIAGKRENDYFSKRTQNGKLDKKTGLYLKDHEMSDEEDVKAVNPAYKNFNSNTKNNCMMCTTAYDLRKRGYDVTAGKDSSGYNFKDISKWYKGAKSESVSNMGADGNRSRKALVANTMRDLAKQGDGARGNIMVQFSTGGGHSMVYQVKNGKVQMLDCQSGKVYNNPERILKSTISVNYVRLDTCTPNFDILKKGGVVR